MAPCPAIRTGQGAIFSIRSVVTRRVSLRTCRRTYIKYRRSFRSGYIDATHSP